MNGGQQTEVEAAALRRLVAHLRERADGQNMDLMERHQVERAGGAGG